MSSLDTLLPAGQPRRVRPPGSSCLALVLPDASDAYGLELLRAVEERSAEHGYHLVVCRTRGRQELEEQAIQTLTGNGVAEGLIVFPVHGEYYNASLVRLVLDRSPLVLVDRYLHGIRACAVYTDNVKAAGTLTSRLIDQGHERLAFLSPPVDNTSSIEERIHGFEAATRARGLATPRTFTGFQSTLPGLERGVAREADREAIRDFVDSEPLVTGFVACEYAIAVLLWEVLGESASPRRQARRRGQRPGGRERVIACFDSPNLPRRMSPFVHVRQDQREMGRRAVDLLVAQVAGDKVPQRTLVPFSIVDPSGHEECP